MTAVSLVLFKVLGFITSWFACLAWYLSSDKQVLRSTSLSCWFGRLAFVGLTTLSVFVFAEFYPVLAAVFLVLALVMMNWIIITLASPHTLSIGRLSTYGTLFMALLGLTGGHYVV